jgi:C1A family cysteine protease
MSVFMTQKYYFGWKPSLPDFRDVPYEAPEMGLLPKEVDLRPQCPAVYNQGQLGSCTANAIAAHLDFNRHKQGEQFIYPSRLFIYYQERFLEDTVDSDSGASIRDSVKVVKQYGAPPESEWPYLINNFELEPTEEAYTDALNYEDLSYLAVGDLLSMKSCLAERFPFVTGITVYESFMGATETVPIPDKRENVLGGHAVMIVGYDDTKECFILRNSWGADWALSGYVYIPYAYLTNPGLSSDRWTLRKVK